MFSCVISVSHHFLSWQNFTIKIFVRIIKKFYLQVFQVKKNRYRSLDFFLYLFFDCMQFIGFIFIDFVERIWFLKFVIFKPEKNSILAEAVSHSVHGLSKQTPSHHHHIMGFTSCSVDSCTNTNKNSSEKFFRFPQDSYPFRYF